MQQSHLTEEQLVAHYFGDSDVPAEAGLHLRGCATCASEYDVLANVLKLVKDAPVPERDENYGEEVWKRLRWRLASDRRRNGWKTLLSLAAMLAVAFVGGLLWRDRTATVPGVNQTSTSPQLVAGAKPEATDRLVFVVVGDHLEASERVLLEVANADPDRRVALETDRAEDLVTANRIYRQTAVQRGDQRVAALLADLEPILIELSHAGAKLEGKKLAEIQKRIESRQLLFKVRVISAGAEAETIPPRASNSDSL